MNKSIISRSIAVILSIVVVMAFSFVPGDQAYAASKKTVYRVVSASFVNTYSNGEVDKWKVTQTYNKNAQLKKYESIRSDGVWKNVFKRNKKGTVTKINEYDGKKLTAVTKSTSINKKGLVTKEKRYVVKDGKKILESVTKNTYYSNRQLKKSSTESTDGSFKYIDCFRKNGTLKKSESIYSDSKRTTTYDKKGSPVKEVYSFGSGGYKTTGTKTFKNKYNKKGDLVKSVETDKSTYAEITETIVTTSTIKYKYDKHGNILKQSKKVVCVDNGEEHVSTYVSKYKYKKFKVAKKYL